MRGFYPITIHQCLQESLLGRAACFHTVLTKDQFGIPSIWGGSFVLDVAPERPFLATVSRTVCCQFL